MAIVAVLSARSPADPSSDPANSSLGDPATPDAGPTLAGRSVEEYQARQTHALGAVAVAILVDAVTPSLTRIVDRLGDDGIRAALVRDLPSLARMIGSGDSVLLVAEAHVLPNPDHAVLAAAPGEAILALPVTPDTRGFERIDAERCWAGALRANGARAVALLDMLGDWDLGLTLLRNVVRDGAARIDCDVAAVLERRLAIVRDTAAAVAVTRALAHGDGALPGPDRDIDDWVVRRPAGLVLPFALRHEVDAAALRIGALALAAAALLAVLGRLPLIGLLLAFAVLIVDHVASRLDRLLRFGGDGGIAARAARPAVLGVIALAGAIAAGGGAIGAAAAIVAAGLVALGPTVRNSVSPCDTPPLLRIAPGAALLLLAVGAAIGLLASATALLLVTAFASVAAQLAKKATGRPDRVL